MKRSFQNYLIFAFDGGRLAQNSQTRLSSTERSAVYVRDQANLLVGGAVVVGFFGGVAVGCRCHRGD
jgi:hypothetical protein